MLKDGAAGSSGVSAEGHRGGHVVLYFKAKEISLPDFPDRPILGGGMSSQSHTEPGSEPGIVVCATFWYFYSKWKRAIHCFDFL